MWGDIKLKKEEHQEIFRRSFPVWDEVSLKKSDVLFVAFEDISFFIKLAIFLLSYKWNFKITFFMPILACLLLLYLLNS